MRFVSGSPAETRRIAAGLAKRTSIKKKKRVARVIALSGELGSGKTEFVRGFLRALGVTKPVQSPTFVLMKRYPVPSEKTIVLHMDAYRIRSVRELRPLGFMETLKKPENILLIEWPERLGGSVPWGAARIRFAHGKKKNERTISIS